VEKKPVVIRKYFSLGIADEPGKPTGLEVVDWDKEHAELKWEKPENDGGAPITGYIIEFKVSKLKISCVFLISEFVN
jgi:hypothetical protein